MECLRAHRIFCLTAGATMALLLWAPASRAAAMPVVPDFGVPGFSVGLGTYKAPHGAKSSSGAYSLLQYQIASFQGEIDYGFTGKNYFLGAVDYLYRVPTAEKITQTRISLGAGMTTFRTIPGKLKPSRARMSWPRSGSFAPTGRTQIRSSGRENRICLRSE